MSLINLPSILTLLLVNFSTLSGELRLISPPQENPPLESRPDIKIEMLPKDFIQQPNAHTRVYQVSYGVRLRLVVTNNSGIPIRTIVVDSYYQNRPQLFKGDRLMPYRGEVTKIIRSKDADPHFVRVGSIVLLEPNAATDLEELNLNDCYGPLEPGSYKLTNRHRFDIAGPWSTRSPELLFDIVSQR